MGGMACGVLSGIKQARGATAATGRTAHRVNSENIAMSTLSHTDFERMPQPPEAPDIDACCGNGCDPCIFDLHDLAMDEYRKALRAWRAVHELQPKLE